MFGGPKNEARPAYEFHPLGHGEMQPQSAVVVHDDIGPKLDEMADLCEIWRKRREQGLMPAAVRGALIQMAREVALMADVEAKHGPRTEKIGR
jgi:hypothetical protein